MINKIKNSMSDFMKGRYGMDILGKRLNILFLILAFASIILSATNKQNGFIMTLAIITLIFMYYRAFSKNYASRMKENEVYKNFETKVMTSFIKLKRRIFGTKTHVYTNCPNCKTEIRLPRDKGKLKVTCPSCKHIFVKRT